ncbi:hypothetical protein JHK84_044904 [Glycine max]|nr:hypothetical protein JHK84_044904 [Glycine max]
MDHILHFLSLELLKEPDMDALFVSQYLHLSFSHITPTPNLILQTLNLSPEVGRIAMHNVLYAASPATGPKTLASVINCLIRVVQFFERMERDYGMKGDHHNA